MPAPEVRPFRRADRDQLTELINLHVAAVVPGVSVSVNTVLSALERQPDEFLTDPWVSERTTLVAEQRGHVVAPPICCATGPTTRWARPTGTSARSTGSSSARPPPSGPTLTRRPTS
ncbi:hypothetical protein GCM10018780_47450 [Streptomyces lanatus]|nr:hypothetical protein GCM10018780_47450 [Streptomyces lanatus]